jgi:hypothetical protein
MLSNLGWNRDLIKYKYTQIDTAWFSVVMLGDRGASTELVKKGKIVPVLN